MFHHALTVAPTISFGRIDTPIFTAKVEVQMGTNSAKYSDMPQANYGHKGKPPSSPPYFKCILSFTCPRYQLNWRKCN